MDGYFIAVLGGNMSVMKKVLLIEDDDFSFVMISDMLLSIGYKADEIIRCTNLAELPMKNREEIEIVLTDLSLPDSSYPNTFNQVIKLFHYTPIIVLTGTAEVEVAMNAIKHGAQDYLVKGEFEKKILSKAMKYAIERNKFLHTLFIEKKKLQATINNTTDVIWSIDRNNQIISANKVFWERVMKITGKRTFEVHRNDFDSDLYETWLGYFERALKGEAYKIVWDETQNGETTYEEVRFNPIYDKNKNVVAVSCFSRDITDQLNYLHRIERQNSQLREIAWVQSHEVRAPVASILGLTELFNSEDPKDPTNTEIVSLLRAAANKLDNVVRKITSYTNTH